MCQAVQVATPTFACDCGKFLHYRGIPTHRNKCQDRIRKIKMQAQDVTFTADGPSPLKSSNLSAPSFTSQDSSLAVTSHMDGDAQTAVPLVTSASQLEPDRQSEDGMALVSQELNSTTVQADRPTTIRSRLRSNKSAQPPATSHPAVPSEPAAIAPTMSSSSNGSAKPSAAVPTGATGSTLPLNACKVGCGKVC